MTVHTKFEFTGTPGHTTPVIVIPHAVWNELWTAMQGRVTETDMDMSTAGYQNSVFYSAAACVIVTPTTLAPPMIENRHG